MASQIKLKRRHTDATAPTTGDLSAEGEVAINTFDKKLYARDNANNIVVIGVQDGTSDGNTLIWDTTTGMWTETSLISISDAGQISINANGNLVITNLPTSDPLNAGELWNDSGTMKVSAG